VRAPAGAIDTCGTGGDGAGTVNLSTGAALACAAMGAAVAKHGNRAMSSRCGSADVLEALGFRTDLDAGEAELAMSRHNFAFLMAPRFHPAMKNVAPVRRALGVRTLFNLLGPLANPAGVRRQVVGVYDPALTGPVAHALLALGSERALVVHGGGLDELALHARTTGHVVDEGAVVPFVHEGRGVPLGALAGGDAARNAAILSSALAGEPGPVLDAIALNAGAALWVAGRAESVVDGEAQAAVRLRRGIDLAPLGATTPAGALAGSP
jgi:anthranilate phosphoribosyltransferase